MIGHSEKIVLRPVVREVPFGKILPLEAFSKLARGHRRSFLLESAEGFSNVARYSFIGAGPKFSLHIRGSNTERKNVNGESALSGEPYESLRNHFTKFVLKGHDHLPPFLGGAVGWIGFDCVGWFERTLESSDAEAELMFFDSAVVFDHLKPRLLIVTLTADAEGFHDHTAAEQENERIAAVLAAPETSALSGEPVNTFSAVRSNFNKRDFETRVSEIKELIRQGICYQVVLSQRFERETAAHPIDIYRNLRSMNPSPYMFLLQMGESSIIGSSPETLVAARHDELRYRPIAGTCPRGSNKAEDARLAEEMRADPKEVSEHMMLVDLGRNDLGRVSQFGSVKVDKLMAVEKFSHVQHLVSELSAKLDPRCDRFDALASCFPAGTVSGAPKVKSVEIIRSLEPQPRGVYAGAVGYFDYGANMDTCIAIRTIVLENGTASVQAGAGIVADSDPECEYEETVNKAKALFRAIDAAEIGPAFILEHLKGVFDRGETFEESNAGEVLDALISETNEDMLFSVFTAWQRKGIEADEIYSIAKVLRGRCFSVNSKDKRILDIVGTGGSKAKRFNVSTAAAFVVAGAGIRVAKHGNKAATSRTGSADVLESLGIKCDDAAVAERCLDEVGICFMYAPNHHRLSPTLAKVRRGLGFPTIFNCVGPLCNPANAQFQLIGTWSSDIACKMAKALARLGTKRSWIIHGVDGLDEVTLSGPTRVWEVANEVVREFEIVPEDFGVQRRSTSAGSSETPLSSAGRIKGLLDPQGPDSEDRELVMINAAAAICIIRDDLDLKKTYAMVRESIANGKALAKLRDLVEATSI